MRKIIFFLNLVFIFFVSLYSKNIDSLYKESRYQEIIDFYKKQNSEQFVAKDYYNIAQANYKLKNLGLAVLNYERAIRLDPSNDTIKNNLDFISSSINDNKATGFRQAIENAVYFFDTDVVYLLAFSFFIGSLLFFVIFRLSNKTRTKIYTFVLSIVFFVICLWFNFSIIYSIYKISSYDSYAIITSNDAKIKLLDNGNISNYDIKEGTKIKVIKASPIESEVKLLEGTKGKILNSKFTYIVQK